jgi:hypothetical protein
MSMKVIIENSTVNERSGNKNGRNWTMRTQEARLQSPLLAGRIELTLRDGQQPYSPGEYDLDLEKSLEIGLYGTLMMGRFLHLTPVKSASVFGKTGTNG